MTSEELLELIGETADEQIQKAKSTGKPPRWTKWAGAVAACLAAAVWIGGFLLVRTGGNEAPKSSAGGSGHDEGSTFMSYAGPVFPLTLLKENSSVSASRIVDFDFLPYLEESEDAERRENDGAGVIVNDGYQLTNQSESDIALSAVYPFAGDFQTTRWPVVTLDGREAKWYLYAGAYSGSFRGAGDARSSSLNLDNITSWEAYRDLLSGGSYFEGAFSAPTVPDRDVTVYKLSDLTDGGRDASAATLCMSFRYDPEKTSILTWGFNGGGIREDTGEEYRCFFIRDGLRKEDEEVKYLIVVGDDLQSYTLQGYQDGGCTPGEQIEGASASVSREEMTLGTLLREIAQIRYDALIGSKFDGDYNRYIDEKISFEMYYQAIVKHFTAFGPGGTDPKERYDFGMLEDLVNEAAYHDRTLYLCFDFSIPAGGSVDIAIEQFREASFDYHCTGSENAGIDGYDMVTEIGSSLAFASQTASITNYDAIEIVRQNFGFDPANGVTEVTLTDPHYYLEVRSVSKKADPSQ